MSWWALVRFLHVSGAVFWVGGQLTVSLILLPIARRALEPGPLATVLRGVGHRFARITLLGFLPVQIATGVALAWRERVTWSALVEPGYGRVLALKLVLFTLVMAASAVHGRASARGHTALSRGAAAFALAGSVGVILLATALVG